MSLVDEPKVNTGEIEIDSVHARMIAAREVQLKLIKELGPYDRRESTYATNESVGIYHYALSTVVVLAAESRDVVSCAIGFGENDTCSITVRGCNTFQNSVYRDSVGVPVADAAAYVIALVDRFTKEFNTAAVTHGEIAKLVNGA